MIREVVMLPLLLLSIVWVARSQEDVRLHHVFLTADSTTYAALAQSSFLRTEFAGFEERTTSVGEGESYTGLYFYGKETYFEILTPDSLFPPGSVGIAFGAESEEELDRWANKLRVDSLPVWSGMRTRVRPDGGSVPWGHEMAVDWPAPVPGPLVTWSVAWHEQYLKEWGVRDDWDGPVTRRAYLSVHYDESRLLRDIVGVTLALSDESRERFLRELKALGARVSHHQESWTITGQEITFRVFAATEAFEGLVAVEFRLNRVWSGSDQIPMSDSSSLRFSGTTAVWTFEDANWGADD